MLKSLLVLLFDESLDVRELAARTVGCLQFGSLSSDDHCSPVLIALRYNQSRRNFTERMSV